MTDSDSIDLICHRCGAILKPGEGAFYLVRIEAVADPTPPQDANSLSPEALAAEYDELLAQLSDLSEQEMLDQVYRRLHLTLCTPCYNHWIEHPTG